MRGSGRSMAAGALVAALAFAAPAAAATFEVTRHNDPNPGKCKPRDCSLREAVLAANERTGGDTVVLPDRRPAYSLTRVNQPPGTGDNTGLRGDLDVSDRITLAHPGRGRATIDANGIDRVLDVLLDSPTQIERLKLTGGDNPATVPPRPSPGRRAAVESGGGIASLSRLRLVRSSVVGNGGVEYGGGIEIFNVPLSLVRSRVSNNASEGLGAGIDQTNGRLRIARSLVSGNESGNAGGGISLADGPLSMTKSTVAGNRALAGAAGVYLYQADGRISQSTISNNVSPQEDAAGLHLTTNSTLELVNSTVSGNRAADGGGGVAVGNGSGLTLRSATIARNVADGDGDGSGTGGGVLADPGTVVATANTIFALNTGSAGAPSDCAGAFTSGGGNLLTTVNGCTGFNPGAGDFVTAAPNLGQLARNGGPTRTIALKKESPAIGKAVENIAPERDQRGVRRDRNPDIGAYER